MGEAAARAEAVRQEKAAKAAKMADTSKGAPILQGTAAALAKQQIDKRHSEAEARAEAAKQAILRKGPRCQFARLSKSSNNTLRHWKRRRPQLLDAMQKPKRVLKVLSKLSLRRGPRCQLARRSKSNSSTRRRLKKRKPRMQSAMQKPKRAPKMRVRLQPKRVRRWAMWHQCKQSGLSFLKWKVKKRWQTRNGMPRPLLA